MRERPGGHRGAFHVIGFIITALRAEAVTV